MFGININQQAIKLSNRAKILNIIAEKEEVTKQEISDTLDLSVPTVINNVNELIEEGLVEEAGVAKSTGGRKPMIIRFKPHARFSIGVDISPNRLKLVLVNLYCEILYEYSEEIKDFNFESIIEKVYSIIEDVLKNREIDRSLILGVGFSLPGLVDEEKLVLENAPNLNVKNFDFKYYEDRYGMPIYIENEANVAAIGEMNLGAAKGQSNVVYISVTEGIGTGIIIQNHLYKSTSKWAGEFGHMRITDEKLRCNCGRTGCWELYASERSLINQFNTKSDNKIKELGEFFNLVKSGDEYANDVLNRYLSYLAVGIENIILALSPEHIIIGGEVSEYEDIYRERLWEKLKQESSFYGIEEIKIGFSKLRGRASVLGASTLAIQNLFTFDKKTI